MVTRGKPGTWVQCTHCGEIYHIDVRVSIDKLHVECYCPKCREHTRAINCGNNKDDVYALYDPILDERYYKY